MPCDLKGREIGAEHLVHEGIDYTEINRNEFIFFTPDGPVQVGINYFHLKGSKCRDLIIKAIGRGSRRQEALEKEYNKEHYKCIFQKGIQPKFRAVA